MLKLLSVIGNRTSYWKISSPHKSYAYDMAMPEIFHFLTFRYCGKVGKAIVLGQCVNAKIAKTANFKTR